MYCVCFVCDDASAIGTLELLGSVSGWIELYNVSG
jgi:hypothetical protein